MTYDLMVWPVDRPMTVEEAVAEIERRRSGFQLGFGHDRRLDPFIAEMERRYPGIRGRGRQEPPCEFDVLRRHVSVGLPWSRVEELSAVVADVAWRSGLAVYDPQREAVGLPSPFAETPIGIDGIDEHVRQANAMLGAIMQSATAGGGGGDGGEEPARRPMSEQLRSIGGRQMSPLGFEITPEIEAEALADPSRIPTSLQTPERKAALLADLASDRVGDRHQALVALAAWDPDPVVAEALRPLLSSNDVFEAAEAANGIARQGEITDLPSLVDLVYRLSPADGGTAQAMLPPLRAALQLAALADPEIVEGLKARARQWRGHRRVLRQAWEGDADAQLDEILGTG